MKNEGFSLVELIASLTLAGILAVALMTIVITALNGFFLSREAIQVSQKAQLALARMRAELVKASAISTATTDKIVFDNEYGTYEIERINNTISLTKTQAPSAAHPRDEGGSPLHVLRFTLHLVPYSPPVTVNLPPSLRPNTSGK